MGRGYGVHRTTARRARRDADSSVIYPHTPAMDLYQHIRAIWRRRWLVLLVSLLVAGAVLAWRESKPKTYRATGLLSITSGHSAGGGSQLHENTVFLGRNFAQRAKTRPVVVEALSRSGLKIDVVTATQRVSASASDEGFLTLAATGPTPADATAMAKGLSDALVATVAAEQRARIDDAVRPVKDEISAIQRQLASLTANSAERTPLQTRYEALVKASTDRELQPVDRIDFVAEARPDPGPVAPHPIRDTALALIVALIVNAELAVAIEALSDRFSNVNEGEEAARVTGLPLLGQVARGEETSVEGIRTLRTNLMFMSSTSGIRSLAVVSVDPGSGKSFISLRLARSVASLGIPVVLLDADLRRPVLHDLVGLERGPGLAEILRGRPPVDCTQSVPDEPNLHLIAAGSPVADPSALFGGTVFSTVAGALAWAELVVVDTPAGGYFSDALAVASQCDAVIVVVDAPSSRRRPTRQLVEQLRQVGANPVGVVVNRSGTTPRTGYYAARRPNATPTKAR